MKKTLIILIILMVAVYSQTEQTVISAKEVLQQQIEQAKLKAEKIAADTAATFDKKPLLVKKSSTIVSPISTKKAQINNTQEVVNNGQLLKIFILFESLLLSLIIVAYIRRKKYFVKVDEQELKMNIKNLRTERALIYENTELSSLRQKLSNLNINLKDEQNL